MSELGAKRREEGVLYRFFVVRKGFHICSFAFFYFLLPLLFLGRGARSRGCELWGLWNGVFVYTWYLRFSWMCS